MVGIKFHGSAREKNREAGDGGELIGTDLRQCFGGGGAEVPEGNAFEGEARLFVVPSHHFDLVAGGGYRADGVIVVAFSVYYLLDGRGLTPIEGDAVLFGVRIDPDAPEFARPAEGEGCEHRRSCEDGERRDYCFLHLSSLLYS